MRLKRKKAIKKTEFLICRCKKTEKNKIKRKANLYCEGNVSEWLIHASINYLPNKEDLEK